MAYRTTLAALSNAEAEKARQLMQTHGTKEAAKLLGLCNEFTLRKAACGELVHPLTVSTLRARLATLDANEGIP
jgi:hypothetical protein